MTKYVTIVPTPIVVRSKAVSSSRSRMPVKPPACVSDTGSRMKKIPIVVMTNCTMSVSVTDHIPPRAE